MIRRRGSFPLVFLFLLFAVSLEAQASGPSGEQNRKILERILRERRIPFRIRGNSLLIPGGKGGGSGESGESGLILAVPLAYPGEAPLGEPLGEHGDGGLGGGERGPGLEAPLRFAVPLSLFGGGEGPENGGAEKEDPGVRALVFLGGADHWAELGEILAALEAPGLGESGRGESGRAEESPPDEAPDLSGESPALPADPAGQGAIVFLDIPHRESGRDPASGPGELIFGLAGAPPLGQILAALRICEALGLPWSFGGPFLASPSGDRESPPGGEPGPGGILIRLGKGRENSGSGGENLGAFLRRYAGDQGPEDGWNGGPERNYLLLRVRGKLFVIGEVPLALGFPGLALLFFCGLLFLPPAAPEGPPRRGRRIPAAVILWLCMALIAAAAFYRLSLYPLLAPALLPAFAGRSIRPALPRRICLAAALLYLGTFFLWGPCKFLVPFITAK